jgi:hypothetical protein
LKLKTSSGIKPAPAFRVAAGLRYQALKCFRESAAPDVNFIDLHLQIEFIPRSCPQLRTAQAIATIVVAISAETYCHVHGESCRFVIKGPISLVYHSDVDQIMRLNKRRPECAHDPAS